MTRSLLRHYQDQLRHARLEKALAECVHHIAATYDSEIQVASVAGDVAPKREPACSIEAKALLGWTP